MPATLDQAFQSPFHKTGTTQSSSTFDIRNDFQDNYRVKNLTDIVSEADDIKSVYHSGPSLSHNAHNSHNSHVPFAPTETHDCNFLIAKILSCVRCRNKLKELLRDDIPEPVRHVQAGGGGNWTGGNNDSALLVNIILGVLLIVLIDLVLR